MLSSFLNVFIVGGFVTARLRVVVDVFTIRGGGRLTVGPISERGGIGSEGSV